MGEPPFHHVYMHGIIRHQDGSKISKSNPQPGDDPLDVIEEYGADALRYWIVTGSTPGQDVRLSLPKIANARNFANKLWNAARFVVLAVTAATTAKRAPTRLDQPGVGGAVDSLALSRDHRGSDRQMEAYQFGEAGRTLEDFLWGEFCDWYIELSKLSLYAGGQGPWQDIARNGTTSLAPRETALAVLRYVLDASLRLLHPIMPFVTEEVWSHLHGDQRPAPALMVAPWPQPGKRDPGVEAGVSAMIEVVHTIRNVRAEAQLDAGRWIPATIAGHGAYGNAARAGATDRGAGPRAIAADRGGTRGEAGTRAVGARRWRRNLALARRGGGRCGEPRASGSRASRSTVADSALGGTACQERFRGEGAGGRRRARAWPFAGAARPPRQGGGTLGAACTALR